MTIYQALLTFRAMNAEQALTKAIESIGGPAQLARAIGIKTQAVSQWKQAPASRCRGIEAATNGAVTRYDLRPDVFGSSPDATLPTLPTPLAQTHA